MNLFLKNRLSILKIYTIFHNLMQKWKLNSYFQKNPLVSAEEIIGDIYTYIYSLTAYAHTYTYTYIYHQ